MSGTTYQSSPLMPEKPAKPAKNPETHQVTNEFQGLAVSELRQVICCFANYVNVGWKLVDTCKDHLGLKKKKDVIGPWAKQTNVMNGTVDALFLLNLLNVDHRNILQCKQQILIYHYFDALLMDPILYKIHYTTIF